MHVSSSTEPRAASYVESIPLRIKFVKKTRNVGRWLHCQGYVGGKHIERELL